MKGVPFPPEIKSLIIQRVKQGDNINDLSVEFHVYPNTIRKWLAQEGISGSNSDNSGKTRNQRSLALLLAKSEREKQALLEIIGELTVINKELSKKKSSGKTNF